VGKKFSNFGSKFDLYCALTPAEYESGLEKILKKFSGTLESHKVFRHFATLAITFPDSSGPPKYYTFFGAPGDALSIWLSKSSFNSRYKKSTFRPRLFDSYHPQKFTRDSSGQHPITSQHPTLQHHSQAQEPPTSQKSVITL